MNISFLLTRSYFQRLLPLLLLTLVAATLWAAPQAANRRREKVEVVVTVLGQGATETAPQPIKNAQIILRKLDGVVEERRRTTNRNGSAKMKIPVGKVAFRCWPMATKFGATIRT
ncbi:MAG: hypothetical protein U0Y68_12185 [Blastocatellia bacterium]